jgi:hypothetical protein
MFLIFVHGTIIEWHTDYCSVTQLCISIFDNFAIAVQQALDGVPGVNVITNSTSNHLVRLDLFQIYLMT